MDEILILLEPIFRKGDCLILNKMTKVAENHTSLICKLTGGKRIDHAKGQRCYGAALAHMNGASYMINPWKSKTGNMTKENIPMQKRKRKIDELTDNIEYGPNAAKPELVPNDLQSQMKTILWKLQKEAGSLMLCSTLD
ncbi:hypothetical protein PR048_013485 [Dryococelus australis]|uniref:Uncharacterized protein n=1 Tax=Dryococelus australis TaxID=614101 RepID=A0ABQ9HSM0_9NEOP|nr:hypothetical protein PR048_013485 [Dryococelus australis]